MLGGCCMQLAKEATGSALAALVAIPLGKLTMLPIKQKNIREYKFESLHKIYFYDAWRWKILQQGKRNV